eukprot:TRINITY_DN5435_c0_g1_i1.p1 TRINITY_DN5435_c0_g1~~TRINITY_DN5435_c0_g1_i1.p1  ORF type:complete len:366 (-),score=91.54 TRINITY_DN5435_c0_g1_i1:110-1207(-)
MFGKKEKKTGDQKKGDNHKSSTDAEKQKKIEDALSSWGGTKIQFQENPKLPMAQLKKELTKRPLTNMHKAQSTPEIYNMTAPSSLDIHEDPIPLRYSAIKYILNKLQRLNAVESQGIFRESGNQNTVRQIVRSLAHSPINIMNSGESVHGVNEYAGALKQYLREAPDPVVPFSEISKFLETLENEDLYVKLFGISRSMSELKKENQLMLRALVLFLKQVVDNSEKNKMTLSNLMISLGPSVFRTREFDMKSTSHCCDLLNTLITHSEDIFALIELEEPEDTPPPSELLASSSFSVMPSSSSSSSMNKNLNKEKKTHLVMDDDDNDDENDEDGDIVDLSEFLGVSYLLSNNRSGDTSGLPKKKSPR